MKKFLLGSALFIAGASVALASDLPIKAPAYKAVPAYNWSGIYGGVHAGYGWGESNVADSIGSEKLKPAGGFGGVQLGYNNHFAPHWLIGGEVDFSAGDLNDSISPPVPQLGGIPNNANNKFGFFGTARTRFGYVQDRWLVYGTAGAIWLRDRYKSNLPSAPGQFDSDVSQYHIGWVFGGGIEYAVDNRWSWKLEYLYAPFDQSRSFLSLRDPSLSIVRAGLNYRFADGGAPASYMPAKAAAPRASWSGSYLGVHGGYGWGKLHELRITDAVSIEPDGGYGGFQGGYNWLFAPKALLGVEVDTSFGDLKGGSSFLPSGVPASAKIEDLGTARLRLGYLVTPDTLVYATGGAAYAREKLAFLTATTRMDHLGWTVGGGVEWKFAPEWSMKAEYLYADLGSFRENDTIIGLSVPSKGDLTLNTVRVGLNYSGPVIERLFGGR
jgi:outer membrane immunogenic protein